MKKLKIKILSYYFLFVLVLLILILLLFMMILALGSSHRLHYTYFIGYGMFILILFYSEYLLLNKINNLEKIKKIERSKKFNFLQKTILLSTVIILIRQLSLIPLGENYFQDLRPFSPKILDIFFIIYVMIVESLILPIFNLFQMISKNVDFKKYHNFLILINILFLLRALYYSISIFI